MDPIRRNICGRTGRPDWRSDIDKPAKNTICLWFNRNYRGGAPRLIGCLGYRRLETSDRPAPPQFRNALAPDAQTFEHFVGVLAQARWWQET